MKTLILTIAIILSQTLALSNSAVAEGTKNSESFKGWVVKIFHESATLEIQADERDSATRIAEQLREEIPAETIIYITFKR